MPRPAGSGLVMTLAIAQLVVGGLMLLCCGFGTAASVPGSQAQTVTVTRNGKTTTMVYDVREEMEKQAPGYKSFALASGFGGVALAVAMVVGGIGLLRARAWGWWISLGWGALAVLYQAATAVYLWTVAMPATRQVLKVMPKDDNHVCGGLVNGNTFYHLGWAVFASVFVLYPLLILLLLILPPVRRPCLSAPAADEPWEEVEEAEEDEDERPRRRRRRDDDDDEDDRPRRRRRYED